MYNLKFDMKKTLLTIALYLGCLIPTTAQIYKGGYTLVYSSETPEAAAAAMDRELTDAEKAVCTGDFTSEENMLRNWVYCDRMSSNWNKRIAVTEEQRHKVNTFDGAYHAFAKQDATETSAAANGWITGAIHMQAEKAATLCDNGTAEEPTECIIEVKAKSNPFASNWTGIWMMPTSTENWPDGGELDIVEEVGKSGELWTVLHLEARDGKWDEASGKVVASDASKALSGKYTFYTSNTKYGGGEHIYSLHKTRNYIAIYVDGELFFKYSKDWSLDFEAHPTFEHAQYPYDQPFYLILNQSVGFNEGWGGCEPTSGHVYESDFSWVRIYKGGKVAPCVETLEENTEYAIQDAMTGLYAAPVKADGAATTDPDLTLQETAAPFTLVKYTAGTAWYVKTEAGKYVNIRSTNMATQLSTSKVRRYKMTYDAGTKTYQIINALTTSNSWSAAGQPGAGIYVNETGGMWRIVKYADIPTEINDVVSAPQQTANHDGKTIRNGRLVITNNGRTYSVDGREIFNY